MSFGRAHAVILITDIPTHNTGLIVRVLGLPVTQIILGVVQNLAALRCVLVRRALGAGDYRRVIEQLQEPLAVTGQDGLLLGTLDGGCELGCVSLLQFLPGLESVRSVSPVPPAIAFGASAA